MKSLKILFVTAMSAFFIISCSNEFKEKFSFEMSFPSAGSEIVIKYNPAGTKLAESKSIDMVVYEYNVDLDQTTGVEMESQNGGWSASFTPSTESRGLIVVFKGDEKLDNNEGDGYLIYMKDKNENVIPGAVAGFAVAQAGWGRYYADLSSDHEMALTNFEEEFKTNPKIKKEYLDNYFSSLYRVKKEAADSAITADLNELGNQKELTEKELSTLATWYGRIKKPDLSEKYTVILQDKYPQSDFVQSNEYSLIYGESNPDKMLKLAEEFEAKFPESDMTGIIYYQIGRKYVESGKIKKLVQFLSEHKEKTHPYLFTYSVKKIIDSGKNLEQALTIADFAVDIDRTELANPKDEQPNFLTEKDWLESREDALSNSLFNKGNVLYKLNRTTDAFPIVEEASKLSGNNEELNELYAVLLHELGKDKESMAEIEDYILEGKSTSKMMDVLKSAYLNVNGSDEGYDNYLAKFTSEAEQKMKEELEREMIDLPAPEFELTGLDGNTYSLKDFAGKVVVLDFWATWCGPCKASFPGMQMTVNKFKDDENVQFFFINAWERSEDIKKSAGDFIKQNKYTFNVLLDLDNKVIDSYKVTGIPTKFIIGKNGRIRFQSIGFSGTDEHLVAEVSTMINLLK